MENGGERYEYIESLNATDAHLDMLYGLLEANMQGWQNTQLTDDAYASREQLAKELGSEK